MEPGWKGAKGSHKVRLNGTGVCDCTQANGLKKNCCSWRPERGACV
jgi:hypothetical protein